MIKIYPEQLKASLKKKLYNLYILYGNDQLFLQESKNCIINHASIFEFNEHIRITMDNNNCWSNLYNKCNSLSLFKNKQIFLLTIPENDVVNFNQRLTMLAKLIKEDILVILHLNKFVNSLNEENYIKDLHDNTIIINCITPEYNRLPYWIFSRAKNMNLNLDKKICNLLCFYYENNLIAIIQILQQLLLVYRNENITFDKVKSLMHDVAYFSVSDWINAIFFGKIKRAEHILNKLSLEINDPVFLLRKIQKEILLLIKIKHRMKHVAINLVFKEEKIWKNHQLILIQAAKRLSIEQLYQAVSLLLKIELSIKQDSNFLVWSNFSELSLLLSGKFNLY